VFGKLWYGEQAGIANKSDKFIKEKSKEEEVCVIPVPKYSRTWLNLRLLMLYIYIYIYIYGAPILDVSRSHTTTQHSR
jgi:hypothetical protein